MWVCACLCLCSMRGSDNVLLVLLPECMYMCVWVLAPSFFIFKQYSCCCYCFALPQMNLVFLWWTKERISIVFFSPNSHHLRRYSLFKAVTMTAWYFYHSANPHLFMRQLTRKGAVLYFYFFSMGLHVCACLWLGAVGCFVQSWAGQLILNR